MLDISFFALCGLFLTVVIKAIGFLLVSSVLTFPALLTKMISDSPLEMIIKSVVVGDTAKQWVL